MRDVTTEVNCVKEVENEIKSSKEGSAKMKSGNLRWETHMAVASELKHRREVKMK